MPKDYKYNKKAFFKLETLEENLDYKKVNMIITIKKLSREF